MRCIACQAVLDSPPAFPGGTIVCACGAENELPAVEERPVTAYRTAGEHAREASMLACPFCGAPCSPDARACPHCSVELASVRCPHCFALHFTGSAFCSRCGKALELEPLLDATDAPCPRCDKPLSRARDDMYECAACGGVFLDHATFEAIQRDRDDHAPVSLGAVQRASQVPEANVRYVKCPMCHEVMNRTNFGRRSGIIVDVCRQHGTWFDAGELTGVIEFISSGGLAELRERDRQEAERLEREAHAAERAAKVTAALRPPPSDPRWLSPLGTWGGRPETLLEILFAFFRS